MPLANGRGGGGALWVPPEANPQAFDRPSFQWAQKILEPSCLVGVMSVVVM